MGKQTSFYMEREVFQELAQEAIDCGCLILRQSGNKIVSSRDTSIITASCDQYYFYLPEAGELDEDLPLGCFNVNGSMVVEANYTTRNKDHSLHRARLYDVSPHAGGRHQHPGLHGKALQEAGQKNENADEIRAHTCGENV